MAGPLRRVKLAELRGFCAAVEQGSLTRAAQLLGISQPALSKRVRDLEALAATPLLERSPRGVRATAAGAVLYEQARELLQGAERLQETIAELRGEPAPVRLAASHTIAEFVLGQALSEYEAREGHHLSVELLVVNSQVVCELVGEGRADFGIAAIDPDNSHPSNLQQLELLEDEVLVAVGATHPWAARSEIALQELLETPMVMRDPSANSRRIVEAALAEHHVDLAPALAEVGSTAGVIASALAENAPALLSSLALPSAKMHACRVNGVRFRRRFAVFYLDENGFSPEVRALIEHLRSRIH
jgi:DNA-binding transcriptional LysR family regulator